MMEKKNNCVVVYRSKSGFTKNYASWIADELHCDLLEGTKTQIIDLQKYDTIIYGAGLYAVGINGIKLITKNFSQLKDKKIIVFGVGASPNRKDSYEAVLHHNIPQELSDKIKFFYLRGGFDYHRLTKFDKILMLLLKIKLKRLKNPDADAKGMLASYDHPQDFTKKKNIEELIQYVREISC